MEKNIALEYLEKGKKRKSQIMFDLKDIEKFNNSKKAMYVFLLINTIAILVFYIIFYISSKQFFYYENFIEYLLSPVLYTVNFIGIIYMISIIITIKKECIKIDFNKKYIKTKLFKKIYFDDIATVRVSQIKDRLNVGLIKYNGENIELNFWIYKDNKKSEEKLEKFLVILKETFKEKVVIEEYQREPQSLKKSIFKSIGSFILLYIAIKLFLGINAKIIENYSSGKDFSRNGVEVVTYDDGYAEIPYKHGLRNGVAKYYTNDKKIEKELEYKNGERVFETEYDKNGKLYRETKYKDDKVEHLKSYYPNGVMDMEFTYNDNFTKEKYFSEDGKLVKEENYKDRKLHGKRLIYYPNGKIFIELEYNEGKVVWPVKVYDREGNLKLEEIAKKSDDFIERKIYDKSGNIFDTQIINKSDLEMWEPYYNKIRAINYFTQKGIMEMEIEILEKI